MSSQLTTNGDALRLFFTDDVYLIAGEERFVENETLSLVKEEVETMVAAPAVSSATPEVTPVQAAPVPSLNTVPETPAAVPEFKFLGKNNRNILILVNDPEQEVSNDAGRELLRKIVKSVNLTASDFALLNYSGYPQATFAQLQSRLSCSLLFAFGVSPAQLGLPAHPQNSLVTEGNIRMIFSSELKQLDADPGAKKTLWASLKQLGL